MLVALALLGLQAASTPPADADPAAGAGMALAECMEMMSAQPTRAAFIEEVRQVGRSMASDPKFAGLAVDDAEGRGCRVTFTGSAAQADQFTAATAKMSPGQMHVERHAAPHGGEIIATTLIDPRP